MTASPIDQKLTALLHGDPALTRNPYSLYDRLRREAPVYRFGSSVFVSTHAEAKAALLDSQRFINRPRAAAFSCSDFSLLSNTEQQWFKELLQFEVGYMSRVDGVPHDRVRMATQPAFNSRDIADVEALVQQLTDELLAELVLHDVADLIALAYRLPLLVIASVLGASLNDVDFLKSRSYALFAPTRRPGTTVQPEAVRRAYQALTEFRDRVNELLALGQTNPGNTFTAALLKAEQDGQITRDELLATCALAFHAGHETTTSLIGNGLLAMLLHRDQWRLLCDDPSLAARAVEEAFRYDAPVPISLRTAAVDVELNGIEVPHGSRVWVLIGSANRDPKAFPNADELDVGRHPNAHLGFGHGVHYCVGAPLARLQARIVFSTLARRFPDVELAGEPESIPRTTDLSLRGVVSLPVVLGP